ncbi:MAG TPA: AAA family ATPase [Candidatus Korarchaeota archaeon]|nr:AAA family ATPase [Candidatus Korarchaeota archaeon]
METTITVRKVDLTVWKEFQKRIVEIYGNLYGNIGREVTNALSLWLKRNKPGTQPSILQTGKPASYKDIGGLKEEIIKMKELVELPLRHPELFKRLSLKPPKGVLLHGPPGAGKNMLARAAANEAGANLYVVSIPDLMDRFYKGSEEELLGIFRMAREKAPSVILISELEAIGSKEKGWATEVGSRILSQLMAAMDSLEDFERVVVIALVNSPESLIPALRRKGRFDHEIKVDLPDEEGRYEILEIQTRKMPLAKDVDLRKLAKMTEGWAGKELYELCQEAALSALRRSLDSMDLVVERIPENVLQSIVVTMKDFLKTYSTMQPSNRPRTDFN